MHNNERTTLAKYRIEKAEECLKSATILKDSGDYMSAANRSYYSIFHCIRAVMALDVVLLRFQQVQKIYGIYKKQVECYERIKKQKTFSS